LVANLYGIMVAELLSWNGLVATSQFPFPGSILKIPPTATVNNPQINVAPDVAAGPSQPGCDPRAAGTYKVAKGDSMYIIRKKFCVSLGSLLSANGFNSSGALLYPGQILNIPASGS
jgi:LysM repeat protein